jgi:hypothetical protein
MNGEKRNACRLQVGKPEGKRSLGIPRHRRVDASERNRMGVLWTGLIWLRIGTSVCLL